jgi:hypothetical protein
LAVFRGGHAKSWITETASGHDSACCRQFASLGTEPQCARNFTECCFLKPGRSPWPRGLRLRLHWSQNNTTQQSGQTPDKEVEIKNITAYVSGYTKTYTIGMLSATTVWRKQSEFVSSRQSGQISAAVSMGCECSCNGQNISNRTC